ncbi:inter-alpha-trypsin inhibitor heavy chain H3-like isoform X2 [Babylonia areolata]|uniref:inter-alpha-trypsin inhibitor heavy chain H3-like isoform X2 n=1 Tax=Babylonia areolata TaxID=304850 RepID=UPI003FD26106
MGNNVQLCLLFLCGFLSALGSSQTIHRMAVRSDVRFRFATTEMTCVMSNDNDAASELTFDVTLPKEAFIANFSMEIEGKTYPGNVRKKQEARQEYLAARRSGSSGGLVEQSARHSNKFDVSVNIAAGRNVTFTLIYQELLRRRNGSYEYAVYIDGKSLSKIQDFSVEIYVQDRNVIENVRTPEMRKEIITNEVEDVNTLTQITNPSETTLYVVYRPTPAQLREQGAGWFVLQYDVESDSAGELLVVDGYFVHFFLPPDDLPPLPLDIVFVLDISGSMAGHKMQQLKDAMRIILDDLRETDRFNILLFDGSVQVWRESLQEASESNVDHAQSYVSAINYRGSTNLHLALMRGLEMLQGSKEKTRVPMMFFLTDGMATSGEQNSEKIVADVSRKNEGVVNIYNLAFGAGADYQLLRQISAKNNGFARKIYEASDAAQQVSGLYREISTIVIRDLRVTYHSSSNNDSGDIIRPPTPLIVDNRTVTICDLSLLFGKSDFVVAGKLQRSTDVGAAMVPERAGGLTMQVSGQGAMQKVNFVLEENDLNQLTLTGDNPFWSVPRDLSKMAERTWAFLSIKQLLKEKTAAQEDQSLVEELEKQILDLSLKYHFVTPLTSMVVTRPQDNLKKSASKEEASFTSDEDLPAVQSGQNQGVRASYSSRRHPMAHSVQRQAMPPRPSVSRHGNMLGHSAGGEPADYDLMGFIPMMTSLPAFTSTRQPPRPTTAPNPLHKRGRKDRKRKGKKSKKGRRGKKKDKKCIRNKRVVLQSVVVQGQGTPGACYELKAARTPVHNYTLFSDLRANFSVTVAMKKKFLQALHIHHRDAQVMVKVNAKGELTSDLPPAGPATPRFNIMPDGQRLHLRQGQVFITVSITKKTCKASFVAVVVGFSGSDTMPIDSFTGVVAKAFEVPRSKRRKAKGKKRRFPKGCKGINVPADRVAIVKGKQLLRYRA